MIEKRQSSFVMNMITNILESQKTRKKDTLLHRSYYHKKRQYLPKKGFNVHDFEYKVFSLNGNHKHMIYLHGGAYVLKGNKMHFQFIKKLHKLTNASVHYIDYQVAPTEIISQIIPKTVNTVLSLIETYKIEELYIIGDSAGGGMALPVTKEILKKKGIVKGLFLISPWLDVTMSNPDIKHLAHNETMFTVEELRQCGNLYTNNFSSNIDASPIFSDYSHIGPITIFQGTKDLLYPDVDLFTSRNKNVNLYLYQDAPHIFPLFPKTNEQKEVLHIIHKKSE